MKERGATLLIVGATSAIAQETARLWAAKGHRMVLVGRNVEKLGHVADDLTARGGQVSDVVQADLGDFSTHPTIVARTLAAFESLDLVFIAHGLYGDQQRAATDVGAAEEIIRVNFTSIVSLLTLLCPHLQRQGHGHIVVISSVAGDRGRQSNYVYGAAKAGLTVYLQGLRNRLYRFGVHVTTVKPGFVDTPMTAHMRKNVLFASPKRVAGAICRAVEKKKDEVYVPSFWFWVMRAIRAIPEGIFKRLRL